MKLKELRLNAKLNQKDVATALGISTQVYSRYEREDHKADYDMLCKMADYFNVSLDELLGRTSEPDIFDNARIEQPEIMQLYERMTPEERNNLVNYARGLISGRELRAASERDRRFA